MKYLKFNFLIIIVLLFVGLVSCKNNSTGPEPLNPDDAPEVAVDRFSDEAGTLFKRSENSALPGPNVPIDFDQSPFITQGLGPDGQIIKYYNFDVLPTASAPIFAFFRESDGAAVEGQLNIIDVIPGDDHYNDFWHVHKVLVPDNYEANTIASVEELMESGYTIERTNIIKNCPVVPKGSTAELRYSSAESTGLVKGWYKEQIVHYFLFEEKAITVELPDEGHPEVPLSDILVTFNINPGMEGGGPPSGFMTEEGTIQTHNVTETLPEDEAYSPLWDVDIYDNADFDNVSDWTSASNATILAQGAAIVNCPVVSVTQ